MSDWEQTGDGAVQTTVEDLLRWDQNFYEPRVGDRDLVAAMQVPGILNSGKKLTYASALVVGSYRGLPTVQHLRGPLHLVRIEVTGHPDAREESQGW